MNALVTVQEEIRNDLSKQQVAFPLGLLGFENVTEYELLEEPGQAPFRWLQVPSDPSLAFVLISPFELVPDYAPDIPKSDCDFLKIDSPDDALLYSIVTLRGPARATANLKGPIVINRHTLTAKQVVLTNAASYELQHPLPIAES